MSMQLYQLTFELFIFRFMSMFTCNNMLRKVKALGNSPSNFGRNKREDLHDYGFKPQLTDAFFACKCIDKDYMVCRRMHIFNI